MNDSRLRFDLADLARQVSPADLRHRVRRTSRLLGIRRAAATSAAVLMVLAGAAGIAFALQPDGRAPGPAPADSSAAVVPSPVEKAPIGTAGTRWYLGETTTELLIHAVRADHDEVSARIPRGSGECIRNTITVSPDGKRLAWVDGDDISGTLTIASTTGAEKRTLDTNVLCLGAKALFWRGGDQLVLRKGESQRIVNLLTGDSSPAAGLQAWSADGAWSAALIDGKPAVTNGKERRDFHYTPPQPEADRYDGWEVRSVSANGRYVAIGWMGTDPSRNDGSFTALDTTTSEPVQLPVTGEVRAIVFAADGTALVRQAGRVVVLDAELHKVSERSESATEQGAPLIAWTP